MGRRFLSVSGIMRLPSTKVWVRRCSKKLSELLDWEAIRQKILDTYIWAGFDDWQFVDWISGALKGTFPILWHEPWNLVDYLWGFIITKLGTWVEEQKQWVYDTGERVLNGLWDYRLD